MIRVLFVCLGNICRSPMAEAMFRDLVKREKLDNIIEVDSAGTGHWHIGKPPHEGTLSILKKYKVGSEGLKARQLKIEDGEDFHYIVAMDSENVKNIHRKLASKGNTQVIQLLDLVKEVKNKDVPDPYFTGDFEEVYELIGKGNQALLQFIKQDQQL
ncbi:low molecular weight protein-tyrosine-phosphatase [Bacillus sp. Hm123]|uniref:low molecular weight protein-tyrosine-phosphatase n=1 Tax=Bacillus sp. Hm123 TaxID=3450745 RepID=UPI003F440FE1